METTGFFRPSFLLEQMTIPPFAGRVTLLRLNQSCCENYQTLRINSDADLVAEHHGNRFSLVFGGAIYKLPVRLQAYNTPSTPVTTYCVPSS